MQPDSYTKAILTVIAVCLVVLVAKLSFPERVNPPAAVKQTLAKTSDELDSEELSGYPKKCNCCSSSDAAIGAYVRQEFGLSPDWDSGEDGLSHFIVIFDGKGTVDSKNIRVGAVGVAYY
jgi:hypothetical protein